MKTSIITHDQIIIHNDDVVKCSDFGESFTVPTGEWAIHFDHETGIGEVEYIDSRVNETINAEQFKQRYQYLIECHGAATVERVRRYDLQQKQIDEMERLENEQSENADTDNNSGSMDDAAQKTAARNTK